MGNRAGRLRSNSRSATVVFLGLNGAGKTEILNKLLGHQRRESIPLTSTHGFSIVRLMQLGFCLRVYDLGGDFEAQKTWKLYCGNAHAVVFVIDAANSKTFIEAGRLLNYLLDLPQLANMPLLILLNKQDIRGAISKKSALNALNLSQIRGRMWQVEETSTVSGNGIQIAFDWLSRSLTETYLSEKQRHRIEDHAKKSRFFPSRVIRDRDKISIQ